ncbi:DUF4166 domain-containing protein [Micrococcales bacterium 31B]|nr:DUF4166 domain-containing protein [Micrococcales bacterium 31B]
MTDGNSSIFRRALGEAEFSRLHPEMQRRFSVGLASGEGCIGAGTMERVWQGKGFVKPFLWLGSTRNILVPVQASNVPFTIENLPYRDRYGRETVTFVRTFTLPRGPRRFDATMVYSEARGCVLDYLGTHQHLGTDLDLSVDDEGGLVIRSGEHRFREGPVDVRVPDWIGADATVRESFDDATGRFRISVNVTNRRFGPLFGYDGSFGARYVAAAKYSRLALLRPRREERREGRRE